MTTLVEIENEVRRLGGKISVPEESLPSFGAPDGFGRPSVEVDSRQYHLVIVDRGEEIMRRSTQQLPELLYLIFCEITFDIATTYEGDNRKPKVDFRRFLFSKQIELLERLNSDWAFRKKCDIDRILHQYPYRDEK